jgi:delta-aminolevulinic acid dehydratase/porphobilinogen synthase
VLCVSALPLCKILFNFEFEVLIVHMT